MDNNNNNSKQIILSIVGIAILVIAVVGVSFAFFTYSKEGENANTLTSGSISLDVQTGSEGLHSQITGTNYFPQTDDEGLADPNNELDFSVAATLPAGHRIKYEIYAIPGDAPDGNAPSATEWVRLDNEAMKMKLTIKEGAIIQNKYYKAKKIENFDTEVDTEGTQGTLLAVGRIIGDGTGTVTHKFQLRMWISADYNNGQIISDTNKSYKYRASKDGDKPDGETNDERKIWSDTFYSMKLRVKATDDPEELNNN